jgi:hypothetical protein
MKYNKVIRILSLIASFFMFSVSCQNKKSNLGLWYLIETDGLPTKNYSFDDMVFVSDNLGFITGALQDGNDPIFETQKAIIYRTDDAGKTWQEKIFKNGCINRILSKNGKLYFLKNVHTSYKGASYITASEVFASSDLGLNWNLAFKYNGFIRDFFVVDDDRMIINVRQTTSPLNSSWQFKEISNGFKVEKILGEFNTSQIVLGQNRLAFNTYNRVLKRAELYYYDFNSSKFSSISDFDFKELENLTIDENDNIWFTIIDSSETTMSIYKISSNNLPKLVATTNLENKEYPDDIKVNGGNIFILMGNMHNLYVSYHYLISSDMGKTFKREDLIEPLLTKPLTNFKNKLILYAGPGKLQIRK